MNEQYKFLLSESEMPTQWYNIIPDLPNPLPPPLNPQTMEPIGPEDLAPLFPMGLILQEVSQDSFIDIPKPVLDLYKLYRPSPLFRAVRLEKALGTNSRIYYKYEGGSPSGSHKPNTAIPQAFYNSEEGVTKMVTETGAGQWGSALAFACQAFGIELEVFQVAASYLAKPYRKTMMEIYGAKVYSSPSERTENKVRAWKCFEPCPNASNHYWRRSTKAIGTGRRLSRYNCRMYWRWFKLCRTFYTFC
jgi:tryptophan synthase beta chain